MTEYFSKQSKLLSTLHEDQNIKKIGSKKFSLKSKSVSVISWFDLVLEIISHNKRRNFFKNLSFQSNYKQTI